jgi:nucleoside-diphosphate-sugar epimerase
VARKTLIIGCGYVGLPLALRLKEQGNEVAGWVHSQASADLLAEHHFSRIVVGSVAADDIWKDICDTYDLVIHCASSGRRGGEAYKEVFLEGARMMARHQPQARKLFVSSTSVYGQTQGEMVTEESAAEPVSATSRILREAENVALASGAMIVRSPGIYGPNRSVLFEKFRGGDAIIEGDGLRWINLIHRDDLVAALLHLAEVGEPGRIYNATDNTPVNYRDFYVWCGDFLGKPVPPFGPVHTQRKRGLTNKRVSNAKLRATGWSPKYPSFREGLGADYKL